MRNRLTRFLICTAACLAMLALLIPSALAKEDAGIADGVEWTFVSGVMTLRGDEAAVLTGPYRPWDAYKPDTRELVIGSTFEEHRDWSGYAGFRALKRVVFEPDYCSACFSDSKALSEVRYTGEHPVFMGMAFIACRLDSIIFDSPDTDYVFDGNFLTNKAGTEIYYYIGSKRTGDLVIPEGIEVIHEGAFAQCSLRSVSLPSTLRVIEGFAFFGVKQLQEITIPASCREIGASAFAGSTLRRVTFLGDSVDFSADSPTFELGKTVRRGGLTFDMCKGLQDVTVPGCGEVPFGLFRNCRGLRHIEFLEGTTKISSFSGAFENCGKVTIFILPDEIDFDGNVLREMSNPIIRCREGTLTAYTAMAYGLKHKFIEKE